MEKLIAELKQLNKEHLRGLYQDANLFRNGKLLSKKEMDSLVFDDNFFNTLAKDISILRDDFVQVHPFLVNLLD